MRVLQRTCYGALTSSPYHKAPRQETRPSTGNQNNWQMFRKRRYWRSSYWRTTTSKSPYDPAERRATMDATPTASMPVLLTADTAGPTDRHTHHMLAMQTPCPGHTMAHPATVGAPPPHTDSPCYSGTAAVATHAYRTGPGGYARDGDLAAQYPGRVACPPRGVPHQTPRPHLPSTGKTPQHEAGGACLSKQTPLLTRGPRDTNHSMDRVPPTTGVPTPMHTQLPHTRAQKETRVCTDECHGDGDCPPRNQGLRHPADQAGQHNALGDHGGRSARPRISGNVPVPHAPARRPEHRHICGRLWHDGPHTGSRRGGSCTMTRQNGPATATPPDGDHYFWGLIAG